MPNRFQLNNLYNRYIAQILPTLLGEPFNIYRPNYAVTDAEAVLVHSNVLTRVDPTRSFIETAFGVPKFFSIFANRALIQPGDLIVFGTYNSPIIDRPYITYAQEGPIKEAIGVRTSKKCHLATGYNQTTNDYDYIAQNLWYDVMDSGHPLEQINQGVKNSQKIPSQSMVMYNFLFSRPGLALDLRTTIVDIDPTTGQPTGNNYIVKQVDVSGQLITMSISSAIGDY